MTRSMNEVETLMQRAALGVGLCPGLADELARAGVWLTRRGLDGVGAVAAGLDGLRASERGGGALWGPTARVAPAAIELALSGEENHAADTAPVALEHVDAPLLLTGYAGAAAEASARIVELRFREAPLRLPLEWELAAALPAAAAGGRVTISAAIRLDKTIPIAAIRRVDPPAIPWRRLERYAAKTRVASTELSRSRGAGEGRPAAS